MNAARDCALCPRLVAYRRVNARENPDWYNGAVPSFGGIEARFLVVGMAPGVTGANRTGRPFTGDFCGTLLYQTLIARGFADGIYQARADDGVVLRDCRITNAARCVPPANKVLPAEIANCNGFLRAEILAMPRLRVILCLGGDSHRAVLRAMALPGSAAKFAHGAEFALPVLVAGRAVTLIDSFHVSRLNTNTKRLTPAMFDAVIARAADLIVP
jgi:uracil-DNA glycosylase family 4